MGLRALNDTPLGMYAVAHDPDVPLVSPQQLGLRNDTENSQKDHEDTSMQTGESLPLVAEETAVVDGATADQRVATSSLAGAAEGYDMSRLSDAALLAVHEAMESITDDARLLLARLTSPVQLSEEAQVHAVSPEGFAITFTTRKATAKDLLEAVSKMLAWLHASKYTPTSGR